MGDRCFLSVYVLPKDVDTAIDRLDVCHEWADHPEVEGGFVRLIDYESNYGALVQRERWAEEGGVFFGDHGAGCDYGAYVFAAVDGVLHEVCCSFPDGGMPVADIGEDGIPDKQQVARAVAYYDALRKIKAMGKPNEIVTMTIYPPEAKP